MLSLTQGTWILFVMIFCHVFDDYVLQGCLSKLKQQRYWNSYMKSYPETKGLYNNDYIAALMCHGFSWSFMVCLPINIITKFNAFYMFLLLAINFVIHVIVDDLKANKKKINLCQDQAIHLAQVFVTWAIFLIIYNY